MSLPPLPRYTGGGEEVHRTESLQQILLSSSAGASQARLRGASLNSAPLANTEAASSLQAFVRCFVWVPCSPARRLSVG